MTRFPDLFSALAAEFPAAAVRQRTQGGRQVRYLTARQVMNRLDEVLGPENWEDEYLPGEKSVLCRLTIRVADPDAAEAAGWARITKADAGGYAGMPDEGDDDKSGYSDAFKRAAVKFGVGRYLYNDGVPSFRGVAETATSPAASVPAEASPPPKIHRPADVAGPRPAPRTGRALFAWVREVEQREGIVLLKYLQNWGKLQEYPGRMVDWDAGQVERAFSEAGRKLAAEVPA